MKKKILMITLLLTMFSGGYALATSVNGTFEGNPIVKLFSGGKELSVSGVPAINYKNRTMVPIYLLNQLGVETVWNSDTQSVDIKLPTSKVVHELTQLQLDDIAKSVYQVFGSTVDPTKSNQGSGFILNDTMITNAHVAGDSGQTLVQIDGTWQKISNYSFVNKVNDVMGFKVSGGKSLSYSTTLPEKGDIVYSIGYPNGKLTISKGFVRYFVDFDSQKIIVHSAATEGGSSGGILINGNGEVIGITSAGRNDDGEYYDDAIPIIYALQELK